MWRRSILRLQVNLAFEQSSEVAMQVPKQLLPLVQELRGLSPADRDLVIQAAEALAKQRDLPTNPVGSVRESEGNRLARRRRSRRLQSPLRRRRREVTSAEHCPNATRSNRGATTKTRIANSAPIAE